MRYRENVNECRARTLFRGLSRGTPANLALPELVSGHGSSTAWGVIEWKERSINCLNYQQVIFWLRFIWRILLSTWSINWPFPQCIEAFWDWKTICYVNGTRFEFCRMATSPTPRWMSPMVSLNLLHWIYTFAACLSSS